jgi:hypothetical protein
MLEQGPFAFRFAGSANRVSQAPVAAELVVQGAALAGLEVQDYAALRAAEARRAFDARHGRVVDDAPAIAGVAGVPMPEAA